MLSSIQGKISILNYGGGAMIKYIIFYIFFSATTVIFSCEEGNRPWFRLVEVNQPKNRIFLLTCLCKLRPSADFKEGLKVLLDNQGNLWAQFKNEKERLPCIDHTTLDVNNATLDFSYKNKVKIIIPLLAAHQSSIT